MAAAIAVLVAMAATNLAWHGAMVSKSARKGFERTSEMRDGMAWVTRDLRRAEDIVEAAAGSLVLTAGGSEVAYRLEGGDLARYEGGARRVVARGLRAANFTADNSEKGILVSVELTGADGGRARTAVFVAAPAGP